MLATRRLGRRPRISANCGTSSLSAVPPINACCYASARGNNTAGRRSSWAGLVIAVFSTWCFTTTAPAAPELTSAGTYYPDAHQWQRRQPATMGFDAKALAAAVTYARVQAVTEPSDLQQVLLDQYIGKEPDYRVLGPTAPRQEDSGLIIRHGYIVAEWGDLQRVDMTFSVVKSYLSSLAGLAWQQGLIDDLQRPVAEWVRDTTFSAPHNRAITWHHLLQQTSDWQGELWGIPDWADRPVGTDPSQWPHRPLHAPGTHFKYNDVRVNLLAYALLHVWREPLPRVLKRHIMDPIQASTTWRWHGYENSWVELDGLRMQSVSGGGHFGGGLFINTLDHARYGLLMLRGGRWRQQQILAPQWLQAIRQPTTVRRDYGYMWWLNTDQQRIPSAPASAYWAAGFGGNYIYIDEANDLLIVLRWIPELSGVVERVLAALKPD